MTLHRHRRPIVIIMALMMAWLSLWTPACLAMGAGQLSMPGMTCDCPFAGQSGDMAAGCAKVDNLSAYVDAKPIPVDSPAFHVLTPTPIELLPPAVSQVTAVLPATDRPPPRTPRRLNIEHCVFLI